MKSHRIHGQLRLANGTVIPISSRLLAEKLVTDQEQIKQLGAALEDCAAARGELAAKVEELGRSLNNIRSSRWVRLGAALRLVPPWRLR